MELERLLLFGLSGDGKPLEMDGEEVWLPPRNPFSGSRCSVCCGLRRALATLVPADPWGEGGEAMPFTAVNDGANGSVVFSFDMYGECVFKSGKCITVVIIQYRWQRGSR